MNKLQDFPGWVWAVKFWSENIRLKSEIAYLRAHLADMAEENICGLDVPEHWNDTAVWTITCGYARRTKNILEANHAK